MTLQVIQGNRKWHDSIGPFCDLQKPSFIVSGILLLVSETKMLTYVTPIAHPLGLDLLSFGYTGHDLPVHQI